MQPRSGGLNVPGRAGALATGPGAFLLLLTAPLPGITPEAQRLAAIFARVVVYWITGALPLWVMALLSSTLAIAGRLRLRGSDVRHPRQAS